MSLQEFLYPRSRYYGDAKAQNLVFNANLQEFSQRVGYIVNFETSGKISPQKAYQDLSELWKCLENSYYQLGIDQDLAE